MNTKNTKNNIKTILLAFILPLAVVWLAVQAQFWFSTRSASPYDSLFALALGVWLATNIRFSDAKFTFIFWLLFLPSLFASVVFVGLLTSCANGDCI